MSPNFKSHIEAKVLLKPIKSQIFLTTLLLLSFSLTGLGVFFLWHEKQHGYLIFFSGLFFVVASLVGWFFSKENTDLDQASPTTISHDEVQIVTDAKSIRSNGASKNIIEIFQALISRAPLPEPSGLFDKDGSIHSDSAAMKKAGDITNEANNLANAACIDAAVALEKAFVLQQNNIADNEVVSDSISKNNIIDHKDT